MTCSIVLLNLPYVDFQIEVCKNEEPKQVANHIEIYLGTQPIFVILDRISNGYRQEFFHINLSSIFAIFALAWKVKQNIF
jgi:hypothetical protein